MYNKHREKTANLNDYNLKNWMVFSNTSLEDLRWLNRENMCWFWPREDTRSTEEGDSWREFLSGKCTGEKRDSMEQQRHCTNMQQLARRYQWLPWPLARGNTILPEWVEKRPHQPAHQKDLVHGRIPGVPTAFEHRLESQLGQDSHTALGRENMPFPSPPNIKAASSPQPAGEMPTPLR